MDEKDKQPQNNGNLKTVRTYLSDMADTVRANEISENDFLYYTYKFYAKA